MANVHQTSTGNSIHIGSGSRHEGVRTDLHTAPPWIENYAKSSLLDHYEIFHMGIVSANLEYRVSRVRSSYTHFLACLSGEAILSSNGKRYELTAGTACLLPKGASYANQPFGSQPWRFCYVCYLHRGPEIGFRGLQSPIVGEYDSLSLHNTIDTLRHDCGRHSDVECQRQLLELTHHLVLRFVSQYQPDERLATLWERVSAAPAEEWSLERLERETHCHREHLRRLCRRFFGRSPAQQVTFIRMQQAAVLLRTTRWTLQHIATEVGYNDAYTFSGAFKRWFKVCPAQYRATA